MDEPAATAEEPHRDQLVAASDAIRNDPVEQTELRRIMADLDRIARGEAFG